MESSGGGATGLNINVSLPVPMVRFLFEIDKIFNDESLNKGNFKVEDIYYNKPIFLYKKKAADLILIN